MLGLLSAQRSSLPRPEVGKKGAAAGESLEEGVEVAAGAGVAVGVGWSWGPGAGERGSGGAEGAISPVSLDSIPKAPPPTPVHHLGPTPMDSPPSPTGAPAAAAAKGLPRALGIRSAWTAALAVYRCKKAAASTASRKTTSYGSAGSLCAASAAGAYGTWSKIASGPAAGALPHRTLTARVLGGVFEPAVSLAPPLPPVRTLREVLHPHRRPHHPLR